jgi:hypothetical protein
MTLKPKIGAGTSVRPIGGAGRARVGGPACVQTISSVVLRHLRGSADVTAFQASGQGVVWGAAGESAANGEHLGCPVSCAETGVRKGAHCTLSTHTRCALQLGVVAAVSAEKGPRGETGVLLRKGAGPATVCLQYPPNTPFRRVRSSCSCCALRWTCQAWPELTDLPGLPGVKLCLCCQQHLAATSCLLSCIQCSEHQRV